MGRKKQEATDRSEFERFRVDKLRETVNPAGVATKASLISPDNTQVYSVFMQRRLRNH